MKFLAIVLTFLILSSCEEPFNKYRWMEDDGLGIFPNRKRMLNDLLKNHQIKGLTYKQLSDSFGQPENDDSFSVYYQIVTDYGGDIDPVYQKVLEIDLNKDSVVTGYKLKEYKH